MLDLRTRLFLILEQGWGGPREHLSWPASEFSLANLEYKIAST